MDDMEVEPMSDDQTRLCEHIAEHALRHGWTIAVAESLTGGELSERLAAAPQASQWYAGAVVAYSSAVKFALLDVPVGPVVNADCARQMSVRIRELMGADLAVATTGVGGPDDTEGQPPGTVWIGLSGLGPTSAVLVRIPGDPAAVVEGASRQCLHALLTRMQQASASTTDGEALGNADPSGAQSARRRWSSLRSRPSWRQYVVGPFASLLDHARDALSSAMSP